MEKQVKKPFKVLDRLRSMKKGIMVENFDDLLVKGKSKLLYPKEQEVVVVLDEDGTEVEDDDYLFSLDDHTTLVLLHPGDRWSNFSASDETDRGPTDSSGRLSNILLKLEKSPGSIALLTEPDLELIVDMDTDCPQFERFDSGFLKDIQQAADSHLSEKDSFYYESRMIGDGNPALLSVPDVKSGVTLV